MADTYHVKDHVVREVVNRLRDTALEFHAHGSLRERLARELEPLLVASRPAEVDGWISVNDRMPTDPLIKFLVTGIAAAGGPLGVHMAELRDGGLYFHEGDMKGGCDPCIDDVVTHWMPLPSASAHTTSKDGK
ncbi:DUF551 domain-containing protein [Oxalobacteraceae sp. CFBP 13730]|nr:DUF551 domain-containing protein [Oxalobacteraceae sp. CFBP 13730]